MLLAANDIIMAVLAAFTLNRFRGAPMIRVGTSGYSYDDWKGAFYPEKIDKKDMLAHYAQHFDVTELNFTYYAIPSPRTIEGMVKRTPENFEFAIKANKATTHERNPSVNKQFKEAIEPAREAGRLSAIVLQFPYAFRNTPENRAYLSELGEDFRDYPTVVEFRHVSWIKDAVFDFLRANNLGYTSVDEPELRGLVPPVAKVTSDVGYVRFHSHDKSKWWEGGGKARYDYLYSEDELREWLPRVREISDDAAKVYIFFNNCHAGHAAVNATQFKQLLRDIGLLTA